MKPFNFFQTAYVVADMAAGEAIAARRFGLPSLQVNRDVSIDTGQGIAKCHFALAFVGAAQIEIIQPAGGADAVYRDMLTPTGLRLHHIGVLLSEAGMWADLTREIDAGGEATPVRGVFGNLMHYLYVDRRNELGHYVEYMYQTPAGAHLFDTVPRYPGPTTQTTK
jgi:hypothetical protein